MEPRGTVREKREENLEDNSKSQDDKSQVDNSQVDNLEEDDNCQDDKEEHKGEDDNIEEDDNNDEHDNMEKKKIYLLNNMGYLKKRKKSAIIRYFMKNLKYSIKVEEDEDEKFK